MKSGTYKDRRCWSDSEIKDKIHNQKKSHRNKWNRMDDRLRSERLTETFRRSEVAAGWA